MRGSVIASLMQTCCAHLCVSASTMAMAVVRDDHFMEDCGGQCWMLLQLGAIWPWWTPTLPPVSLMSWTNPLSWTGKINKQPKMDTNTPAPLCVGFYCENEASIGFSKLQSHKRSTIFVFLGKSYPISRPCCHFPQPRPSELTTHRLKSYFNKAHNHKIIRSRHITKKSDMGINTRQARLIRLRKNTQ